MNQLKKRLSSIAVAAAVALSGGILPVSDTLFKVMPVTAVEETDPGTNYYIDAQGNRHSIPKSSVMTVTADDTEWFTDYVVVPAGTKMTVKERVYVKSDNVCLILMDDSEVKFNNGIDVPEGGGLTIYAQSTDEHMGKITCTGRNTFSGIGGGTHLVLVPHDRVHREFYKHEHHDTGTIIINGGDITAKGGEWAAGIGGTGNGTFFKGGNIIVNGGKVYAEGGRLGAGIGGGCCSRGGTVLITGGEVTARAGELGAGIGNGYNPYNKMTEGETVKVTITGRDVKAYGSSSGAGIGGSYDDPGGTVTIKGGTVETAGQQYGIGSGSSPLVSEKPGTLTVSENMVLRSGNKENPTQEYKVGDKGYMNTYMYVTPKAHQIGTGEDGAGGIVCAGKLTLTGVDIVGNISESYFGGGVFVTGELDLNGGSIAYNTAKSGAGICVSRGTFNMHSGSIVSNTADSKGCAVWLTGANSVITDGIISGNEGGGMRYGSGRLTVKGSPFISENTDGGKECNLFVANTDRQLRSCSAGHCVSCNEG